MRHYNPILRQYSSNLRSHMTDAERRLWSALRLRQLNGYQFYRQRIIEDYIVDFFCPKAKLVIEVDGGQHYSEDGLASDAKRDDFLANQG